MYAKRAHLRPQHIPKRLLARLARMIHRLTRERRDFQPRRTRDIQNHTFAPLPHLPLIQHRIRSKHVPIDVRACHGDDILDFEFRERGGCTNGKPGIVNENVDVRDLGDQGGYGGGEGRVGGHVDGGGEDFEIGMGRLELGREGFEFVAGAGEEDEGCLFGGEAAGNGGTNAH